jgi:hypothetical protein
MTNGDDDLATTRGWWAGLSRSEQALLVLYAVLAVGGLVTTWWNNLRFFAEPDSGGITGYIEAGLANPAAAALTFDVLFVGLAAQVFMLVEGRRIGFPYPALLGFVAAGALVAIAVAFPAFLIARQLRVSHRDVSRGTMSAPATPPMATN